MSGQKCQVVGLFVCDVTCNVICHSILGSELPFAFYHFFPSVQGRDEQVHQFTPFGPVLMQTPCLKSQAKKDISTPKS